MPQEVWRQLVLVASPLGDVALSSERLNRQGDFRPSTFAERGPRLRRGVEMGERLRVLLVDEHLLMRAGLASVLGAQPDIEICGEAGSAEEALRLYAEHRPDVTLMDLKMSGLDGVEGTGSCDAGFRTRAS
jgi:PleD family two-component response regulator